MLPPDLPIRVANHSGQFAEEQFIRENAHDYHKIMRSNNTIRLLSVLIAFLTSLILCSPVLAYNNPDLLPEKFTPVIDLAKTLNDNQKIKLENSLIDYEDQTGWKIRVLSQYDRTPGIAVRKFWDLDELSLLVVADPRGGNLLNFNVGDALYVLMPRTFWVELQTRYGNQYYVRDHGEDGAILGAISSVKYCLDKGGCQVVPGLPREQWLFTLSTSILGGLIAGFAAFPRQEEQTKTIAWAWLLLFSPLWIMLFGVFGVAPVITRTTDMLPLIRNCLGFLSSLIGAYLLAQATLGKDLDTEPKIQK